ncbi:MAG TPA: HD domain-containing phosphohydrolase [Gemmatimonadales bacterium]|jgi:HD-GYP domain-containing protein (c-di-GMP phosphodiesterase class II)|nr:HD domain-containing phosphohydrolase [Gemmatimonadales bacterium]
MSEAIRFLHALAQALSTMALYSPGHPATRRSADHLWQALTALLATEPNPVFHFLGSSPVFGGRALHELRDWQHSRRLADAGVQRLEFDSAATLESLAAFLEQMMVRLTTGAADPAGEAPLPGIAFGAVAVFEDVVTEEEPRAQAAEGGRELQVDLHDELDAMDYIRSEAARGVVARAEAEAVVRILGGLLDHHELPQAAHGDDHALYHVVHPVNTALLVMAAATASGIDRVGRHRIGVIALFHDIGMARLPAELGRRETLTPAERGLVETHTALGARLLLDAGSHGLELAAIVAYEHHLRPDGGGYPARRFRPAVHWASRVIAVSATYCAVRAPRPFRPPWSSDRALRYLEEGAGTVFDADAARLVAGLVRPV